MVSAQVSTQVSTPVPDIQPLFGDCSAAKKPIDKYNLSIINIKSYIESQLKYPAVALENGIQGRVTVKFTIDTLGKPKDFVLIKDLDGGCGAEAIRLVQAMPNWTPATTKNKAIEIEIFLPISFVINDEYTTDGSTLNWGNLIMENITNTQLKDHSKTPIIVRDPSGKEISVSGLRLTYTRGKRKREASSTGSMNEAIQTIIEKVKSNSDVYIEVFWENKGAIKKLNRRYHIE